MKEDSTATYFDAEAESWSQRYGERRQFRDRLRTVLDWVAGRPAPSELLDYGCGSGDLIVNLAKAGHRVTGVDVSPAMLAASRKALVAAGVSPANYTLEQVQADGSCAAFSRSYDGITSLGVLEYMDDPTAALKTFARILRPGGFLIVSIPNQLSLLRRVERLVFQHPDPFRRLDLFRNLTGDDCYLHFQRHQFRLSEVDALMAALGLKLGRKLYHAGPPAVLAPLEKLEAVGMTLIVEFVKPA